MAPALSLILVSVATTAAATQVSFLSTKASDDSCTCLNWKKTFAAGVSCGKTAEYYMATHQTSIADDDGLGRTWGPLLQPYVCRDFFEKIDDNFCVNINQGVDQGQWCFVAPGCTSLNGGAPYLGEDLDSPDFSWKKCEKGKDKMLRDYSPQRLPNVAKTMGLELGMLHKMSYPLGYGWDHNVLWQDVAAFWDVKPDTVKEVPEDMKHFFYSLNAGSLNAGLTALGSMHKWLDMHWGDGTIRDDVKEEMLAVKASGVPHSFDMAADHRAPTKDIIVQGEKVFLVIGENLICMKGC